VLQAAVLLSGAGPGPRQSPGQKQGQGQGQGPLTFLTPLAACALAPSQRACVVRLLELLELGCRQADGGEHQARLEPVTRTLWAFATAGMGHENAGRGETESLPPELRAPALRGLLALLKRPDCTETALVHGKIVSTLTFFTNSTKFKSIF
jgi:hypothetical protein